MANYLAGSGMPGMAARLPGFGLAAGLTLCLVYQLRQLGRCSYNANPHDEPPAATGMWGELFDRLYRYQKANALPKAGCEQPRAYSRILGSDA